MLKAVREAKVHTSWINPNEEYERALSGFVDALLKSLERNPFLTDFLPAQKRIARYGMLNSLSQALIKFVSPGVPDIYQGNELWDFSLVDPGQPAARSTTRSAPPCCASYEARFRRRGRDASERSAACSTRWKTGASSSTSPGKRSPCGRDIRICSSRAATLPLPAAGERAEHVCAFARAHEGRHGDRGRAAALLSG